MTRIMLVDDEENVLRASQTSFLSGAQSARPVHTQQILFRLVVEFKRALVGVMHCIADAAGKMHIGGGDRHAAVLRFHRHDALERVCLVSPTAHGMR